MGKAFISHNNSSHKHGEVTIYQLQHIAES